jgi:hypothetical protein
MRRPRWFTRLVIVALLFLAREGRAARCEGPRSPIELGIDLAQQDRCDPLIPERCLLPFPSDHFTVRDRGTKTGRRVRFVREALPANVLGAHLDPSELNALDGFSPGAAALAWMPTVDLARSGAPSITDIGRSREPDSPIVIVDARTGERWPVWAELDMNAAPGNRALIIRPATNLLEGHRYVVGIRALVDAGGAPCTGPQF